MSSAPDHLVRDILDGHTVTSSRTIAHVSHIIQSMSLQTSPIAKESYISPKKDLHIRKRALITQTLPCAPLPVSPAYLMAMCHEHSVK